MSPRRRQIPSPEPFLWLLFSGGGVAAALLAPVLLVLLGLAFPLGWVEAPDYDHLAAVVRHPLTRLAVLGLCVLALFHFAHRFRYTLHDGLQIKSALTAVVCYGTALLGSALAAAVVLTV